MKFLLIEDDLTLRESLASMISMIYNNIQIDLAGDGNIGLEMFLTNSYDIILSDINLPSMNGLELIACIRKIDQKIPIVVISSHQEISVLLHAIELNLSKYIIKPFDFYDLKNTIDTLLANISQTKIFHFSSNTFINLETNFVHTLENIISLTKSESKLLKYFIDNIDRELSSENIFDHLWGYDKTYSVESIRTIIKKLRKKIPECKIDNIYGRPFKILCQLSKIINTQGMTHENRNRCRAICS